MDKYIRKIRNCYSNDPLSPLVEKLTHKLNEFYKH
jgi:hypothetical protein